MIRFKEWSITTIGEYPTVNRVTIGKEGKREGEEIHNAVYFPRDMLGALQILQRVTITDATRDCKNIQEAITAIEEHHKELIALIKSTL